MKLNKTKLIGLALVIAIGASFALVPRQKIPYQIGYQGPPVVCNMLDMYTLSTTNSVPTTTQRHGFPFTYTGYRGSCPPPSPNPTLKILYDFAIGGVAGAAIAVGLHKYRRKK